MQQSNGVGKCEVSKRLAWYLEDMEVHCNDERLGELCECNTARAPATYFSPATVLAATVLGMGELCELNTARSSVT